VPEILKTQITSVCTILQLNVKSLPAETPACLAAVDLLIDRLGLSLIGTTLNSRRHITCTA